MVFDPLSYENLGASITRALDDVTPVPLTEIEKFDGAGIYALYYLGPFEPYATLSEVNQREGGPTWAIYVGKAETENARKGEPNQSSFEVTHEIGPKLFNRVKTHRKSIEAAGNLDPADFMVRMLAVAPTWVPLAEVVAIRMHQPLWNKVIDGLGNHNPGRGRKDGARTRWDTLHPGRPWAYDYPANADDAAALSQEARDFLRVRALG